MPVRGSPGGCSVYGLSFACLWVSLVVPQSPIPIYCDLRSVSRVPPLQGSTADSDTHRDRALQTVRIYSSTAVYSGQQRSTDYSGLQRSAAVYSLQLRTANLQSTWSTTPL